ncbi:hypothetical protein PIB30_019378 [Stylosanthes scabra]|uniref:Uncharacterized protein n=1 Tax=Stylosanthes scabra TaxID=79078 RepID=A0ABU6Y7V6_9FABA|nr:hypothetical protein [Stylosanthes scabra]
MIGAGKNGPPGKYERWLSSASSRSVRLAMITDRSSKKKSKEDKGKSIAFDTPTNSHIPYPSVLVGSDNNASSKDVSNHFFDPP